MAESRERGFILTSLGMALIYMIHIKYKYNKFIELLKSFLVVLRRFVMYMVCNVGLIYYSRKCVAILHIIGMLGWNILGTSYKLPGTILMMFEYVM